MTITIEYGRKGFTIPNMDMVNFTDPSIALGKVIMATICRCIYIHSSYVFTCMPTTLATIG